MDVICGSVLGSCVTYPLCALTLICKGLLWCLNKAHYIATGPEQGPNNVNVIAVIIPKINFFKTKCQLISNEVLAISVKVLILKGIKM